MADILDPDHIAQLVQEQAPAQPQWRYIRPLGDAADDLIEQSLNKEGRFMFGISAVDVMVRGVGPGEMCLVIGKSHSAKTQVLINAIVNNPNGRILWVTPDEVAELVLMKLVTMVECIEPEHLEKRLAAGEQEAIDLLKDVANHHFPNLIVVDKSVDAVQIEVALDEATSHWDAPADLVVFDYLELMPGEGESSGVTSNANALKALAMKHRVPLCVVHQSSRTGSKRGQAGGMEAMRYGGEAAATYVLECYRKGDDESASEFERAQHANTVTVNVAKNKRPPCTKGHVDLYIHPTFGYVRAIRAGDIGTPEQHTRAVPSFERAGRESQGDMIARMRAERDAS